MFSRFLFSWFKGICSLLNKLVFIQSVCTQVYMFKLEIILKENTLKHLLRLQSGKRSQDVTLQSLLIWANVSAILNCRSSCHLPAPVNNRNTRTRFEIFSKLTIKIPKQRQSRRYDFFFAYFEHISHLV